jgi:hypothetical protein
VVLALLVACDAPTSPAESFAYDPTVLTDGVYHWQRGRTIAIYVQEGGGPDGFDIVRATQEAAARWNAAATLGEFALVTTADPRAADVVVRFRFAPPIVDLRGCEPAGGGAGRTVFCGDENPAPVLPLLEGGGGRVKAEVYVDPEQTSDVVLQALGITRQQHFVALVTHELGHVLGLGAHSDDTLDIMNTFPRVAGPSARDARTLRWVWLQPADLLL